MKRLFRRPLRPHARAVISGIADDRAPSGVVEFRQTGWGVLVIAYIRGLPTDQSPQGGGVFGFHIHSGTRCSGDSQDPLALTGGHFNPSNAEHPYHAGDLPPLFETNGRAYLSVLTGRFALRDIIGRAVVIHANRHTHCHSFREITHLHLLLVFYLL